MEIKHVLKNGAWIIICKCVQMILSLLVTMLTARYLGPGNYGILNYAISITSFVSPIALLGINSVMVQEIISHKDEEGKIVGTSLLMSVISSLLCIIGVLLFVSIANRGERDTFIVCGLYSIMLIFQSLEMIQYWYQAKLLSKYTSLTMMFAYFVVSGYKILLLIKGASIYSFALSYALDYFITSSVLIFLYQKKGTQKLRFSKKIGKRIISKSKYYIISTLMVTLFAQQDKVMLKIMIGNEATGIYSAAVTCATMSGFIFVAIIDSVRPLIYENKLINQKKYETSIINLYSIIIYLSILQGIVCTVFAKQIITIIYGNDYAQSIEVLQIIIWYSAFSYIGGIRDVWLLAENKQRYLLIINSCGALGNLVLNYILITVLGINGAAWASLLTQAFTNVGITFFLKPIRRNNYFVFTAVNPKYALQMAKRLTNIFSK
ncbi:hypothetical protein B5G11_07435 [Drancourtella sp. An57]|uniref:flippase n=1 Tax=Drancourtella sp. An57 TaxID=1965647 RepID=UPI000B39E1BE|nr:flippase [Drancourtella sp. An57]OUN70159.1 hypothetical protein B5G11_07435 [Drancourtella sp. An57]